MMRDDTTVADCAMPPPQRSLPPALYTPVAGLPAASDATVVPCPTTSSTLVLFGGEDTWMKCRVTRPASVGWLRFTPESTNPIVMPCPVRPAPSAPPALVRLK